MESLKDPKKQPHEGKKISGEDQTDNSTSLNNTPAKPVLDMELDEEQLDIISGGVDPALVILKP